MSETPRKFHIVPDAEQELTRESVVDPAYIGGKLDKFAPDNFKGKDSIMVNGFVAGESSDSRMRRLNIRFYNPEVQPGPFRTVAEFAYRNVSVPEHDVDKVYLRYISGKFRLQKLERVTQTRKFIFTDCGSDVLARVSEWLDSYQIDENIKPI